MFLSGPPGRRTTAAGRRRRTGQAAATPERTCPRDAGRSANDALAPALLTRKD